MTRLEEVRGALRLSWRQLTHDKVRLLTAIAGVLFAAVLVFMQRGFEDALYDSATAIQLKTRGDLFLVHRQSEALWRTTNFTRRRLAQALALPEALGTSALYVGQAAWKNPWNRTNRTILVLGFDPDDPLLMLPELTAARALLTQPDVCLFDRYSRPEFGPVAQALAGGGTLHVEVNNRRIAVAGVVQLGASFAADGNLITSDRNFLRLFPGRSESAIDVGVVRLRPGADVAAARQRLATLLPEDVMVLDYPGYVAWEKRYWQSGSPIGFIFTFGTLMGLAIGMVIVYQILFTDITNHLPEYATLKAMGYTDAYFLWVVFGTSAVLAILGYIPGLLLALGLYQLTENATFLPMNLYASKAAAVFALILAMCVAAGALATRKLRAANPADIF